MKVTEQTKATAQQIADYHIANPGKHDQMSYVGKNGEEVGSPEEIPDDMCGTTMCIAGTAVFLNEGVAGLRRCEDGSVTGQGFFDAGAEYLGLNEVEAIDLFINTEDNELALDAVLAIAAGDEDKFNSLVG